jgi:predicted 3-demethylubiquinone-9 3-methyltransferase (glyoxalase superfamily)
VADIKQKITPMLWFDTQAEEAAQYYVSIFKDSRIGRVSRYGEAGPGPAGTVMTIEFVLGGQAFTAINGGPAFTFTEAVSFVVGCGSQEEVDYYWDRLVQGGPVEAQICGWLKDKFGVSWQIVPTLLAELMSDPDPEKATRTTKAMLQMKKLDIAVLQAAHDGATAG